MSGQRYVVYHTTTGRIRNIYMVRTPGGIGIQTIPSGHDYLEGDADLETQYVDVSVPAVIDRPTFAGFDTTEIDADGEDVATLTAPEGKVFQVDGEPVTIGSEGMLEIAADSPGVYTVEIGDQAAFPYMPFSADITAT